jgi:twitching motility protein PilT
MMKLEHLLREAVERKASDIYITTGTKPVFRISGDLIVADKEEELTAHKAEEYLFDIMTEAQREEFKQKMDIDFAIELPEARFRVNVFFQRKGIGGIFRLIPSKIITMKELGVPETFEKIPKFPNGLVLVTGPTGSGKSTTLASIIEEINVHTDAHIITIEDPIEFVYENKKSVVDQREVGTHTGSFQNALRAALREDPDVILVGEMRDLETIALAITAAETGHLVLATLHTSGAAKTIDRIINVFPGERQNQIRSELSEVIRAVIWQELLKRSDGKGRVAAYEILFANAAVANLIRSNKSYQIPGVIETSAKEGMQSMEQSLASLIKQGIVTREEAGDHFPQEAPEAKKAPPAAS